MSQVGDHRMSNANMRVRDVRIAAERSCDAGFEPGLDHNL
jgi:hypothetical protein